MEPIQVLNHLEQQLEHFFSKKEMIGTISRLSGTSDDVEEIERLCKLNNFNVSFGLMKTQHKINYVDIEGDKTPHSLRITYGDRGLFSIMPFNAITNENDDSIKILSYAHHDNIRYSDYENKSNQSRLTNNLDFDALKFELQLLYGNDEDLIDNIIRLEIFKYLMIKNGMGQVHEGSEGILMYFYNNPDFVEIDLTVPLWETRREKTR